MEIQIGDGFSQKFSHNNFHVARTALQFRVETFESQLRLVRLAAGRQKLWPVLLLVAVVVVVSNWNGEADDDDDDDDGASTRWSERASEANERASFRLDVRCERDCRARQPIASCDGQANEFHTLSSGHTHTHRVRERARESHARYRAVCGSGCCL